MIANLLSAPEAGLAPGQKSFAGQALGKLKLPLVELRGPKEPLT